MKLQEIHHLNYNNIHNVASEELGQSRVQINKVQIIKVPLYLSLAMCTSRCVQCMLPLNVTFLHFLLWLLGTRYGMCGFHDIPFSPH